MKEQKFTKEQIKEIKEILKTEAFCHEIDSDKFNVCCSSKVLKKLSKVTGTTLSLIQVPYYIITNMNNLIQGANPKSKDVVNTILFSEDENINVFSDFINFEDLNIESREYKKLFVEI